MKTFFSLIYLISLAGLCGCYPTCVRNSIYQLPQTNLDATLSEAKTKGPFCQGSFPSQKWWEFFQDPTLNYFIELSLACHPDIAIADSRVRLAQNEAIIARSKLYPYIDLKVEATKERVGKNSSPIPGVFGTLSEAQINLLSSSYELDIWKKNTALYYAELDEVAARIAEYEEAKLILSTTIAQVYFDLQVNLKRLAINAERIKARKELFGLLRQQFDQEIIDEYRLYETDTEVEQIQNLIYILESEIEVDKHALAALVGNLGCGCIDLNFTPSGHFQEFPLPECLPIDLLARRPDITAQLWRIYAAGFGVHAAKMLFYPQIDLNSFAGFLSFVPSQLFTGESLIALARVTGTLPLFTAGQLKAVFRIASENLEIAIEEYNRLVLQAVNEVSDALTNLTFAESRREALTHAIQDTKNLLQLTVQRFENGIANRIAVLNAEENLYIQQDIEAEVELVRFQSAVDLMHAIGGGYYDYCQYAY